MEPGQEDGHHRRPKKSSAVDSASHTIIGKRVQVSRACKRCAGSKRKCSGTFPCERCVRMGLADSCEEVETKRAKGDIGGDEGASHHATHAPYYQESAASSAGAPAETRRKRPADDDARSEISISTAMARARLADGSVRAKVATLPERQSDDSEASDKQLAANLDLLLRASGDSDTKVDNEGAVQAARAQVRAALRSGRLMPRQVEIAPGVSVDLMPPPGVLVDATHEPTALSPYPAIRLTFPRNCVDGQPAAVAFNAEALTLFGASPEALPRAVSPGLARAPGRAQAAPLWLHPDEVTPRAQLAAYVRSRGGRYYEWPGRYVCTVWREVPLDSPDASHPEAVLLPVTSHGSVGGGTAVGVKVTSPSPARKPTVLVPRHVLFCAWERVFLSYHPRQQLPPGASSSSRPPRRAVAQALSVFTCIEPLGQELFLASAGGASAQASSGAGSSDGKSGPAQPPSMTSRLRYSFGAGYLPDPTVASAAAAGASVGAIIQAPFTARTANSMDSSAHGAAGASSVSGHADAARAGAAGSSAAADASAGSMHVDNDADLAIPLGLDSSLGALAGIGVPRLSAASVRRASAVSGLASALSPLGPVGRSGSMPLPWGSVGVGLNTMAGRGSMGSIGLPGAAGAAGIRLGSMAGAGADAGSGAANRSAAFSPPLRYRTGLSFGSLSSMMDISAGLSSGLGSAANSSGNLLALPGAAGLLVPAAPEGPVFFPDGPHEPFKMKKGDAGTGKTRSRSVKAAVAAGSSSGIELPLAVPREQLDGDGGWDSDADQFEGPGRTVVGAMGSPPLGAAMPAPASAAAAGDVAWMGVSGSVIGPGLLPAAAAAGGASGPTRGASSFSEPFPSSVIPSGMVARMSMDGAFLPGTGLASGAAGSVMGHGAGAGLLHPAPRAGAYSQAALYGGVNVNSETSMAIMAAYGAGGQAAHRSFADPSVSEPGLGLRYSSFSALGLQVPQATPGATGRLTAQGAGTGRPGLLSAFSDSSMTGLSLPGVGAGGGMGMGGVVHGLAGGPAGYLAGAGGSVMMGHGMPASALSPGLAGPILPGGAPSVGGRSGGGFVTGSGVGMPGMPVRLGSGDSLMGRGSFS